MRQYKDADVRICLRKMLGHFELSDERLAAEPVAKAHGIRSMTKQLRTAAKGMWELPDDERPQYVERYTLPPVGKGGGKSRIMFDDDDEQKLLQVACDAACDGGFPLSKFDVRALMIALVQDRPGDPNRAGAQYQVSMKFVKKWMAVNRMGHFATSSLDPKRAEKATPELCERWFSLIETYMKKLKTSGRSPHASYAD